MKNKKLIEDLKNVCNDLDYNSSIGKSKNNLFQLYILSNGLKKFYQDYKKLLKKYPEFNLGYKGEKIEEFIKRINKPKVYIPGNKSKILKMLTKKELTINEMAKKLNMTRQGARYLVKELTKEKKVEIKSVAKFGNNKYSIRGLN